MGCSLRVRLGQGGRCVMQTMKYASRRHFVILLGVAALVSAPLWAVRLMFPEGYPWELSFALVPFIAVTNLLLIYQFTRRDPELGHVALVAYIVKLAATGVYMAVVFD